MDRRRLAMASAVVVSMGVGAATGATVFTPGVGLAATDDGGGAMICAGAIRGDVFGAGAFGLSPIRTAADTIGIQPVALLSALRDGRTIADVAEANGVDAAEVVDAVVAERGAWLDDAVADGRLTREDADERVAALERFVTDLVNGGPLPLPVPRPGRHGRWFPAPSTALPGSATSDASVR